VVTLKEKNKELKKMETFKKKIEDRYKDKVKELKTTQKEKQVIEEFVRAIMPAGKV
jgi:hypothetical protein